MSVSEVPEIPAEEVVEQTSTQQTQEVSSTENVVPMQLESLEQLREISPELYTAILDGIYTQFKSQQDASLKRFKEALREGEKR